MTSLTTRCCIAGGGPAGVMLGYLLARSGLDVVVLEKHVDFLRDFRGDTVHPSTLQVMDELGLLSDFLARPHQEVPGLSAMLGDTFIPIADFRHLPTRCKFIALMPQWDFLTFLTQKGARFPGFHLMMETVATDLIVEEGAVVGVHATSRGEPLDVRAEFVVGADGRGSTVRARAGLAVRDFGAPIDVLWLRLTKQPGDPPYTFGHLIGNRLMVLIDRGEYWQCAYVIPKGGYAALRARGLPALRAELAVFMPPPADRLEQLADWDAVKLLTVALDRLETWTKPGLLFIGDAAHAMSPIGGVGINLAIQDAVAAANILVPVMRSRRVRESDLKAVQERRAFPVRMTQALQAFAHDRIFGGIDSPPPTRATRTPIPLPLKLLGWCAPLRRIPAYIIGLGFRPEHVRTPELSASGAPAVRY